ncbi:MAG TPA: hypothetical protein VLD67_17480, partial [Vicinamibacterales bacterium]|nr:hypothetical protein [Vicinamibacterales bacterium]
MRRKAHQPARRRAAPSPRRARWIAGGIVVVAALLVYANTLNNPFVYDDFHTVVANPSLRPPLSLEFVLVHSPFRPVVNLSYALDRAVWGFRPAGFHLTNTLLHATMAGLVFLVITGAITDARERRGEPARADGLDVLAASAAAVLFAVHPLMSSAVAYVSGRSELLCGVFFAAGLLCARSAMSRGDLARPDTSPARPAVDRHRFAGALAILLGAFAVL